MAVRSHGVDRNLVACHRVCIMRHIERPQQARAGDKKLVVDNVHAQALTPAEAERVLPVLRVAEVGILGEGFLICWVGRFEVAGWVEGFWVRVPGFNAVDGPGVLLAGCWADEVGS